MALIDGDKVLLIQRARAPYSGLWTLPGGRVEAGETAEQCAIREISEELGQTISELRPVVTQLLKSSSGTWRLAVLATRSFSGAIMPSDEIMDHRWVSRDEVTALHTTAGLDGVLARAFAILPAS